MNRSLRNTLSKILCCCAFATPVFADASLPSDVENYFSLLSTVTRYSPVDGAGSHSGLPAQLGAGVGQAKSQTESLSSARIYILQGLIWPVDVGLSVGNIPDAKTYLGGAHLQANLFEGFRLPALALRGHYSSTFGQDEAEIKVYGGEIVASYGFLRYLTFFGSYGVAHTEGELHLGENPPTFILRESAELADTYEYRKRSLLQALGLHLQIIPGVFVAAAEAQRDQSNGIVQMVGKIAYGL